MSAITLPSLLALAVARASSHREVVHFQDNHYGAGTVLLLRPEGYHHEFDLVLREWQSDDPVGRRQLGRQGSHVCLPNKFDGQFH